MSELITKLSIEAARIEEDAEHSYKGQYNASYRWGHYHLYLGLSSAVIAASSGTVAFNNYPKFAGGLALLSMAFTTVLTFLKPSERSEFHQVAAGHYQSLRNQARIFREIEMNNRTSSEEPEMKSRLLNLAKLRDDLNQSSPVISRCDYELAKKDIDGGRASYKIDKENP